MTRNGPKQKAPGPATARLSLYATFNYVWNTRLVRHRGNTRKRLRTTADIFCPAVCSQTTLIWKSAYLFWILEPLFMSRRAVERAWFSAGKDRRDLAILSSPSTCPSFWAGATRLFARTEQFVPVSSDNTKETGRSLFSTCSEKLKIFQFFRRRFDIFGENLGNRT